MQRCKCSAGFTMLEMVMVLAVIAILCTMALPSFESKATRAQINESIDLIKNLKDGVNLFYMTAHKFPRNNLEAGIPKPEFLMGNFVQRIDFVNGTFHINFGNKAHGVLKNKILSIRPMIVKDSPESPISWLCGNANIPDGMIAIGENRTDITNNYLPMNCF